MLVNLNWINSIIQLHSWLKFRVKQREFFDFAKRKFWEKKKWDWKKFEEQANDFDSQKLQRSAKIVEVGKNESNDRTNCESKEDFI